MFSGLPPEADIDPRDGHVRTSGCMTDLRWSPASGLVKGSMRRASPDSGQGLDPGVFVYADRLSFRCDDRRPRGGWKQIHPAEAKLSRDAGLRLGIVYEDAATASYFTRLEGILSACLLYTSDAADE